MKYVEPLSTLRSARTVAVVLAMSLGAAAQAAQTDIASTPIITTTAALVKPNIMVLMDASGSMARTHMPDEVETQTGTTSVGYKSSQCNALYYNPSQQYFLPKRADGTNFPVPSFTSAPYAGFGSYYLTPDLTTTDLSSNFVAYDATTLEVAPPFPDTPQPAYYYVYTGAQTLNFATAPCTDLDTGVSRGATGGGNWTKVVVNGLTAAEKQNFAIWYSYYRTRIAMIKSAASLAFTPLTDSFRVGFITVNPKYPNNVPITSDSLSAPINPDKYLRIADFDSTQRNLWFDKLFSQKTGGTSPAREGLARVGRHYAGKTDGINTGMPEDPVQYSCQQNFTIMTTDGYWNDNAETVGAGPVKIDGVTKVGQQDGNLDAMTTNTDAGIVNFNGTPRPIWDGVPDGKRVRTNKSNAYRYSPCGVYFYKTEEQVNRATSQITAATSQTTQSTTQSLQSTAQMRLTSLQTLQSSTQMSMSTVQEPLVTLSLRMATAVKDSFSPAV